MKDYVKMDNELVEAIIVQSSCCFFSTGLAMAWTSPSFAKVKNKETDFTLEQYEMSLIAALAFAGRFISPLPMSYLMDIIGRRNCLIFGRILQLIHWMMIYSSHNIWVMYAARLIYGWYGGITLFVIPVYISETTHKTIRGRAQGLLNMQFLVGIVFESIVGSLLSYDNLILVSAGVDLFLFLFMVFIPESPYYYLKEGDHKEAERILQWLRGREVNVEIELLRIETDMERQLAHKSQYKEICNEANRKAFVISFMLMGLQRLCGMTAMIPYGSFIFPNTRWLPSVKGPILLNLTYLIMCGVSGTLVDSWGRKNFLILSSSGACIFLVGCTIWFFLEHKTDVDVTGTEWIVVIFIVLQGAFYATGFFYIPPLVMSELFPINIKAKANALSTMIGVTISTTIVYLFLPLTNTFGLYSNFLIYSTFTLVGAIYSSTIIETKGKSLEAIQAILEGKVYREDSVAEDSDKV